MRVIGGVHGGRRLRAPRGRDTRPTSDRVREALFSSLAQHVPGARVLDLFAGSGALGIEALSRGAESAVFVERHAGALSALRHNVEVLDVRAWIIAADVARVTARDVAAAQQQDAPITLVFADPPYAEPLTTVVGVLGRLVEARMLAPHAHIVVERDRRAIDTLPPWLELRQRRKYGDTALLYLGVSETPPSDERP